jgi:hypothetical protein
MYVRTHTDRLTERAAMELLGQHARRRLTVDGVPPRNDLPHQVQGVLALDGLDVVLVATVRRHVQASYLNVLEDVPCTREDVFGIELAENAAGLGIQVDVAEWAGLDQLTVGIDGDALGARMPVDGHHLDTTNTKTHNSPTPPLPSPRSARLPHLKVAGDVVDGTMHGWWWFQYAHHARRATLWCGVNYSPPASC